MKRGLAFLSPLEVHSILTGYCTVIPQGNPELSAGVMILDLAATHPTNKIMGHVVAHMESDDLVLSKPFRLDLPANLPSSHVGYDLVLNQDTSRLN